MSYRASLGPGCWVEVKLARIRLVCSSISSDVNARILAWLDVHTRSVKEYAAETGRSGPQAQEAFSESEPPFARHGHSENSSPPGPIKTINPSSNRHS